MKKQGRKSVVLLAGAAWIATATAAQSCGFEVPNSVTSARAMIDWVYPKSLHVISAVWKAQLDGVIAGSPQKKPATSILGSYATATHLLRRLADRIHPNLSKEPAPSLSLVLIGPVLWTSYNGREFQLHRAGPAPGDVVIVTDQPVIEALLNGRLTADSAESQGLLRYYGAQADVMAIRSLLRQAQPREPGKNSPS